MLVVMVVSFGTFHLISAFFQFVLHIVSFLSCLVWSSPLRSCSRAAGHGGEVASRPPRGGVRGDHPLRGPLAVRAKRGRRPRLALVFSQALRLIGVRKIPPPARARQPWTLDLLSGPDRVSLEEGVSDLGGSGRVSSRVEQLGFALPRAFAAALLWASNRAAFDDRSVGIR